MLKGSKKCNLTPEECNNIVQHLLTKAKPTGRLGKGVAGAVAALFGCSAVNVRRIWRRAAVDFTGTKTICRDVAPQKKGRCGRKIRHQDVQERIKAVPQSRRYCFRSLAHALGIPKSTLHSYYQRGIIAKYSSYLKPTLTESNKLCRLKWALDHVRDIDGDKFLDSMYDTVHVDEKWFLMTREKKVVNGAPGEKIKRRSCKSKRYLLMVMFLSAVARPRWEESRQAWFDGKIGTWPFTHVSPAKRRSSRREAGTPVIQSVSVTRDTYKAMLIDNVIPAIRAKWPRDESRRITIQQDNARPHVPPSDAEIVKACKSGGWDMEMVFQPPNSPDQNVLDLGFFRAIQTLQVERYSSTLEEIVAATEDAWSQVSAQTLNKNFVTLQTCMQEVIRIFGCNDYKVPHLKKDALLARGRLPEMVPCDRDVWSAGRSVIVGVDYAAHMQALRLEVRKNIELGDVCTLIEKLTVDNDNEAEGQDDMVSALNLIDLFE